MLTKHSVRVLLGYIHTGEAQLGFYESSSLLHQLEARRTLFDLHKILSLSYDGIDEDLLLQYLNERWRRVQNTDIQYLHDFTHPANTACIAIAKYLGELLHRPYLVLLMPTLKDVDCDEYLTSSYNEELELSEIILSDCNKRIIHVLDVLDSAQEDGQLKHNSLFHGQVKCLSDTERNKVLSRHSCIKEAYDAVQARAHFKWFGETVGAYLHRLIEGLRDGGAHGLGEEFNSGVDANVAILVFSEYLETLSDDTKDALMRAMKFDRFQYMANPTSISIEMLWGRLARPNDKNYKEATYCVQLIANQLAEILENNPFLYDLLSYEGDAVENFSTLQAAFVEKRENIDQHLKSMTKHVFYGEAPENRLYIDLLINIQRDVDFVLSMSEIALLADQYALAKEQNRAAIIGPMETLLVDLNRRYYVGKIIQALEKMSDKAKQAYVELTGFKSVPSVPSSFFSKVPVVKRTAGLADLDDDSSRAMRSMPLP